MTEDNRDRDGIVTKLSPRSVPDTVARLTSMLGGKELKLFATIDQSAEASAAGLTLRETVLVIFGNPAAGTLVMQAAPLSALDLPLKVLVWADGAQTKVTYVAPAALASALWSMTAKSFSPLPASMPVSRVTVSGTDRGLSLVTISSWPPVLSSVIAWSPDRGRQAAGAARCRGWHTACQISWGRR